MIALSPTLQNLLSQELIEIFVMVSVGDYKTTNYFRDITLSNGETYISDGRLLAVDTPTITSVVDRVQYKIMFADPDFYFGAMFEPDGVDSYMGKNVLVRVGVVNKATGAPLTNIADTIVAYAGKVDFGAYDMDLSDVGESTFVMSCTSPMGDLDQVRTFYTTKTAYEDYDPTDTSFEQIYEGSGSISLLWGK
jgi:hypothetical protein